MFIRALVFLMVLSAGGAAAIAQEAVLIIRHSEKQLSGDDPALTQAGRERAVRWSVLAGEAGVDRVLTSDARRTRETGTLIAAALGVPRGELAVADTAGLIDLITFDHAEETVLVVGHRETIPGLLAGLGVEGPLFVEEDDFASLFVVTAVEDGPTMLRLRMP